MHRKRERKRERYYHGRFSLWLMSLFKRTIRGWGPVPRRTPASTCSPSRAAGSPTRWARSPSKVVWSPHWTAQPPVTVFWPPVQSHVMPSSRALHASGKPQLLMSQGYIRPLGLQLSRNPKSSLSSHLFVDPGPPGPQRSLDPQPSLWPHLFLDSSLLDLKPPLNDPKPSSNLKPQRSLASRQIGNHYRYLGHHAVASLRCCPLDRN